MPCLPCRTSVMGLIQMASREGRGPTSDVPVMVHGLGAGGFVPEGFLSPRLCMLCGSIFCPPAVDVVAQVEDFRDAVNGPLEVARTGSVTHARTTIGGNASNTVFASTTGMGGAGVPDYPTMGVRSSGGVGSTFPGVMGGGGGVGGGGMSNERRKPVPVVIEFRPNTAGRLLELLEERCRATRGAMDDAAMEEARDAVRRAYAAWKEAHELEGEPDLNR